MRRTYTSGSTAEWVAEMAKRLEPAPAGISTHRNRTSPGGTIRFDRDLTRMGIGRIQFSSGTADPREFNYRNGVITRLVEDGDIETLRALKDRELSIQELAQAHRRGRLSTALQEARAARAALSSGVPAAPSTQPSTGAIDEPDGSGATKPVSTPATTSDPVRALGLLVMQMLGGTANAPDSHADVLRALSPALGPAMMGTATSGGPLLPQGAAASSPLASAGAPVPGAIGSLAGGASVGLAALNGAFSPMAAVPGLDTVWPQESLPLWNTLLDRIVPTLDCGPETKRRYGTSLESLRRKLLAYQPDPELAKMSRRDAPDAKKVDYVALAVETLHVLAADAATIGDLRRMNRKFWSSLRTQWDASAADWNHMRRGLSATLTALFGYPAHPFRQQLMRMIELRNEGKGRVPDLTPELFWEIIDHMPDHAKSAPVVLVATGFRLKEYLATTRAHLLPHTRGIKVPGTKTPASDDTIYVAEEIWPWIETGIPAPLQRRWIWTHWTRACKAVGLKDLHLHDLRHCLGQWAVGAGCDERDVQWALRHRDPNMTRRYTQTRGKRNVARAMGQVLKR